MKVRSVFTGTLSIICLVILMGCDYKGTFATPFNKAQWDSMDDVNSFPLRQAMLKDLTEHHKIKGLTYHQLIDSLGEPANYGDNKDSIYYDIVINYGYLDPKSGEYLTIGFNKDSVATGFKIVDWKNRHANE